MGHGSTSSNTVTSWSLQRTRSDAAARRAEHLAWAVGSERSLAFVVGLTNDARRTTLTVTDGT